jgi:hypothetical protein
MFINLDIARAARYDAGATIFNTTKEYQQSEQQNDAG